MADKWPNWEKVPMTAAERKWLLAFRAHCERLHRVQVEDRAVLGLCRAGYRPLQAAKGMPDLPPAEAS